MLHFLDTEMNSFPTSVTTLLFSFTIFWKLIDGSYVRDVAINCGYHGKSTALDGREWFGDMDSSSDISVLQPRGHSRSSIPHQKSLFADPIPYMTARTSATQFYYSLPVNPGQKFIRLHFYPSASYQGFENSLDFFTVKAGPFTLLRNFSASLAVDATGVHYIIKEFCVNVKENEFLNLTFTPTQSAKGKNHHAYVNGIEIITMPTGLYFTPDDDLGARVVGQSNRYFHIDNSTALETVQRLNIGGSSISPVEDFGMFRRWNADSNYLLGSELQPVNHLVSWTNTGLYTFSAPPRIFHTSWRTANNGRTSNAYYNFTWKIPVDLGFGYLVRLYFFDFALAEREGKGINVNVLIDNQVAETAVDVIRLSGRNGVPIYRDYMVMMKGDEVDRCDLFVALQSYDELAIQLLRGLEIFKLSNPDNNLASKNEVYLKQVSAASWNLKTKHVLSAFDKKNAIVTVITILLILLNLIFSKLRQSGEESTCHKEEDSQLASRKQSCRKFSLAQINLATQNFSDAFLIGRGGFGYVYKGFIRGGSETVAIKRLKSKLQARGSNGEDGTYLTWEQRLSICIGVARGLDYLHAGIEHEIIHRDVKDSNILLDKNFVAKISDFGLSKLKNVSESQGNLSTKVKGTPGFVDPDYFMTHKPTTKTDVYAFGIVMLVVLCGRPAIDRSIPWEPRSLLSLFQEHKRKGCVNGMVDPSMQGKISTQSLNEFINSLENCIHIEPRERPTMSQVAISLEWALEKQQSTMTCNPEEAPAASSASGQSSDDEFVQPFGLCAIHEEEFTSSPTERISREVINDLLSPPSPQRGEIKRAIFRKTFISSAMEALWKKRKTSTKQDPLLGFPGLAYFSFSSVAATTNNFSEENKLGQGAFADVYKGKLPCGEEIAVKRLSRKACQRLEEFKNEVVLMTKLQHGNLVRLLGCCIYGEEKILLYEYMANRSLDYFLFDSARKNQLDWKRRLSIIEGVARGLLYLHRDAGLRIIHLDLKPRHILLDEDMNPKIADFGKARILGEKENDAYTSKIVGTYGRMAPEYTREGLFSVKSDVYSFGVLLLEIVSGRKITSFCSDEYWNIIGCARDLWERGRSLELLDTTIADSSSQNEVKKCIHIAMLCVQDSAAHRPNMSAVMLMLESDHPNLPLPTEPTPLISRRASTDLETLSSNDVTISTIIGR